MLGQIFSFLAVIACTSALECYVNKTHVERCSSAFDFLFVPSCFNKTEKTESGHHRHTYGCAETLYKILPKGTSGSYCFNTDSFPLYGKGELCICTTDKCNYIPVVHTYRKSRLGNNYTQSAHFLNALSILAIVSAVVV